MRDWSRSEFLEALKRSGNVSLACDCAGVSRTVAYETYNADESFANQWDDALHDWLSTRTRSARRRLEAVAG